ncbi:MAG: BadF/BadG/BcrA/BcrD ATPase family protein [Gemmatimonadales bacterium]
MRALLGVDAGGSRTVAAAADAAGTILARAEAGPGAVRPTRAKTAAAAIFTAGKDALQRARLTAPAAALVVGAAGVAHPEEHAALAAALEGCGLATRLIVTTDAEIALAAAFGDAPGIVLLAGTGSVAWARFPDGTSARAGGLGPVLGDRGSGHDIGREALRTVGVDLEMDIGLSLTKRLLDHLGVGAPDLPRWTLAASVADISALAPLVLDAAAADDGVARAIAQQGARSLATLAAGLARRFPAGAKLQVAWGGGLLKRSDYRALVASSLREFIPGVVIVEGPVDSAAGAIRMAMKLAN